MKKLFNKIFLSFRYLKSSRNSAIKLKKIKTNIDLNKGIIPKEIINEYINLFRPLKKKPSVDFLECMINISGIASYQYIPENIHYSCIEPALNSRPFALCYNDKNLFELILAEFKNLFPDAILRGINGVIYNSSYNYIGNNEISKIISNLNIGEDFIIKPGIETGGGSNVKVIQKKSDAIKEKNGDFEIPFDSFAKYMMTKFNGNFIMQKKIQQSNYFSCFNESSLNTVRLYTYRSVIDETIIPLHAYIRFGNIGSPVDSSSQGGRTCGVSLDGKLNSFALGRYGEKYQNLQVLKKHKGLPVPKFQDMIKFSKAIAPFFKYHRLLGFDFAVDDNNAVRLLEVNNLYVGIINQQMNTGPLFREYTKEIIDFCSTAKRSFNYHFYY
jgi:hypothetical protein